VDDGFALARLRVELAGEVDKVHAERQILEVPATCRAAQPKPPIRPSPRSKNSVTSTASLTLFMRLPRAA
jgi:hypothetical protein